MTNHYPEISHTQTPAESEPKGSIAMLAGVACGAVAQSNPNIVGTIAYATVGSALVYAGFIRQFLLRD